VYGRIYSDTIRNGGGVVDLSRYIAPKFEPEIALVLGRTIRRATTGRDLILAIAEIRPAFEIIDSRIEGGPTNVIDLVADNSLAAGVVVSDEGIAFDPVRLNDLLCHLDVNGHLVTTKCSDFVTAGLVESVAWLVTKLSASKIPLRAGDLILTGTCAPPFALAAGGLVTATFGDLGSVSASAK
jgi:2-keto-4-pentenoate hydratase